MESPFKLAKVALAPSVTVAASAFGRVQGLPWDVLIPWVMLLAFVITAVQAWLDGTIIHRREYGRLVTELDKCWSIIATLNPAFGSAVDMLRHKVENESGEININVDVKADKES